MGFPPVGEMKGKTAFSVMYFDSLCKGNYTGLIWPVRASRDDYCGGVIDAGKF